MCLYQSPKFLGSAKTNNVINKYLNIATIRHILSNRIETYHQCKSFHSSRKRSPSSAPSTPSSSQPNKLSNKGRATIIKSFNSTTIVATSAPLTTQTPPKTSSSSNKLSIKDRGTTINQTSVEERCSLERTIDIKIIRTPHKRSRTIINQTQVNRNCSFKRTIDIESSLHHGWRCNKQMPPKSSSLHKGSRTGEARRTRE